MDAVIGVLGVFVVTRRGGGVTFPSDTFGSWNAAILLVVGVLSGNKFNGGNLSGCRFFFLTGAALLCWSTSEVVPARACFLGFDSRSFRVASLIDPLPERLAVEALLILLASKGILDLRWVKNGGSAGDSFGDSYAFGIAGTGGTSCSSSFPAELCTFRDFGVGSLEDVVAGGSDGIRGCNEPADVRAVLWFVLDPAENAEVYNLRFISGVVRDEDGVGTFLGSIEGDRDAARVGASGCGVGGVFGIGGAVCIMDNRFARLASVGLTVLAPKPVA